MMLYYIVLAIICDEVRMCGVRATNFSTWSLACIVDSTLSMLHHLPRSFPQHHPILRYALDTYYGCLQSSYICGHNGFRYLCCSTNSAMLPHWLSYMVFCKQRSITYFARKPSRVMITCSQGFRYLYYSTNSVTPPFDLSTI
ncbi:uncharacterized protein LOC126873823 isoform X2 [Bombus huntii]|uniref:uncharacterized protein LOC126873823 isoform X2 n=1 Tax=Bombus huntii TaxID=85661 RepID=UPI0021A9E57B|nr:uncharacterized protein LOC126873823 isoform X2 [Bombus huntii]